MTCNSDTVNYQRKISPGLQAPLITITRSGGAALGNFEGYEQILAQDSV